MHMKQTRSVGDDGEVEDVEQSFKIYMCDKTKFVLLFCDSVFDLRPSL